MRPRIPGKPKLPTEPCQITDSYGFINWAQSRGLQPHINAVVAPNNVALIGGQLYRYELKKAPDLQAEYCKQLGKQAVTQRGE